MEILLPLFTAVIFMGLIVGIKKTYDHYNNRPGLYGIFGKHFAFFINQAINPYLDTLFNREDQCTLRTIRNITWEEMVYKIPDLPLDPSFQTEMIRRYYVSIEIKNITLNRVLRETAQSHPEVQYQLCVFFERILPLIKKMEKNEDDLGYLHCIEVMQKLFENYANKETRAKFATEMSDYLVEVPSLVKE